MPLKNSLCEIAIIISLLAGACGCSTFSQQAVDSNVVRCREQCQAGLEAARRGKDENALETFAAACESCPIDERARHLYAESLWNHGSQVAAMEQMAEAQRLSGGDPESTIRLGQMYLATGDIHRARDEAARAIAAAPRSAEAWGLEGDVLARHEQYDAALARYHRALSYRNEFPEVQFSIAGHLRPARTACASAGDAGGSRNAVRTAEDPAATPHHAWTIVRKPRPP